MMDPPDAPSSSGRLGRRASEAGPSRQASISSSTNSERRASVASPSRHGSVSVANPSRRGSAASGGLVSPARHGSVYGRYVDMAGRFGSVSESISWGSMDASSGSKPSSPKTSAIVSAMAAAVKAVEVIPPESGPPGKDYRVVNMDAASFLWGLLWSPNKTSHVEFDILDTIVLQNGAINSWLFTTKEGEVKSKAKRRWNEASVVDRLKGPRNGIYGFLYSGGQWTYVTTEEMVRHLLQSGAGKVAVLPYAQLVPTTTLPGTDGKVADGKAAGLHSSFLRVDYEYVFNLDQTTARGNDMGEPRMRYWSLCHAQTMGKAPDASSAAQLRLPANTVVCRNAALCAQGARLLKKVLRLIETDTGRRVTRLSLLFCVQDQLGDKNAEDAARLWLMHAQEVCLVHKNNSNVNVDSMRASGIISSNSVGGGEGASLASSLSIATSLANIFLKPSYACAGDFCRYVADASEMAAGGVGSMAMETSLLAEDESFDVKSEAQRAIQRHRRHSVTGSPPAGATRASLHSAESEDGGDGSSRPPAGPVHELLPAAATAASLCSEDRTLGAASWSPSKLSAKALRNMMPTKERFVLNKSVASAREEMDAVEQIEADMGASESESKIVAMKERLAAVWPMHIVRWWLGIGRNQPKNPRLGKVSSVTSKAPPNINVANTAQVLRRVDASSSSPSTVNSVASASATGSMLDPDEHGDERCGQKWFSFHHTPARVCESCYRVYSELDKHRDRRLLALKAKPKALDKDEARELERRIFAQRKHCSKLSSQRPVVSEDDAYADMTDSGISGGAPGGTWRRRSTSKDQRPSRDLPPLPGRRAHTKSAGSLLSGEPRLPQHMLKRTPGSVSELPSHEAHELEEQWRSATDRSRWEALNAYHPPRLVPVEESKPKVSVDNYTADNLLHPWQREFQKMKKMVFGGGAPSAGGGSGGAADAEDPFTQMVGLGSRTNTAAGLPLTAGGSSRPTTNHASLRGPGSASPLPAGPGSSTGTLVRNMSWTASESIAEEDHHLDEMRGGEDEDDDDDAILGGGQLGWNPFVLQA